MKEVIVVNPADKFSDSMGTNADSCVVHGKFLSSYTVIGGTAAVSALFSLNPFNLGGRASTVAAIFANYRFKMCVFRVFAGAATASQTNLFTFGILDDSTGAEGDGPTTYQGVAELRTSSVVPVSQGVFTRTWKPADPKMWYKTYSGQSGSDPRLVSTGEVYIGVPAQGNIVVDIEVDFSIAFKGAVDTVSSVRLQHETDGYESVPSLTNQPGTSPPVRGAPPPHPAARIFSLVRSK
jgi:hypothetical protein